MKILLIHNYYRYRGGEETYFESLIKLLKKNRHQVITYVKDNRKIKSINNKLNITKNLFYAKKIEQELTYLIQTHKPDIAQFQNIFPLITPIAYKVCKTFNVSIIQRISNYRYLCPKGVLFRDDKICEECVMKKFKYPAIVHGCYDNSRLASLFFASSFYYHKEILKSFDLVDYFIFPTEFVRGYYLKYAALNKSRTLVIPTFTNINTLKPPKNFQVKDKDYFLYVGRLSKEKGIIELLKVFKTLPNVKLVVIGDGPLKNKVQQYSKYKSIILKGFQPRNVILKYIKQAKAVIIPSLWYDVMPNVLIESISQNTPVLVPKSGVFPELVKKNQGFFYEQNNFNNLKSIIQRINNFKKVNSAKDHNNFTPEKHIDKLIGLYKSLKYDK